MPDFLSRPLRPACFSVGLMIVTLAAGANGISAQETLPEPTVPAPPATLVAAHRNLELAELRLLRYDRVDYPLAQKRLENQIEMAKLEIESLQRGVREYEQFSRNAYSSPFFFTLEANRLALKDAELRLDMLLRERCLRVQYRGAMRRIRELEVEQSRDWVERLAE